jgi:hypothetical protein
VGLLGEPRESVKRPESIEGVTGSSPSTDCGADGLDDGALRSHPPRSNAPCLRGGNQSVAEGREGLRKECRKRTGRPLPFSPCDPTPLA